MKVEIIFGTGNAAFEAAVEEQITHILHWVAGQIRLGNTRGKVRDLNGNMVGHWSMDADADGVDDARG